METKQINKNNVGIFNYNALGAFVEFYSNGLSKIIKRGSFSVFVPTKHKFFPKKLALKSLLSYKMFKSALRKTTSKRFYW